MAFNIIIKKELMNMLQKIFKNAINIKILKDEGINPIIFTESDKNVLNPIKKYAQQVWIDENKDYFDSQGILDLVLKTAENTT